MTISELGSVGELIGAIATVATLLYLALQIRANTLADKYKAINDIIDRIVGWQSRIANSTDLMEAWIQGTKSYNELQIENKLRFSAIVFDIFTACEACLEAAKHGVIKSKSSNAVKVIIGYLLKNQGVQEYWISVGLDTYAKDFVDQVNLIREDMKSDSYNENGPLPFHMPLTI